MLEHVVLPSLSDIDRDAWEKCFPCELENYDYLLAVERAGLPGFSWRYLVTRDELGVLAAAPAFVTAYNLETTLAGTARQVIEKMRCAVPDALTLHLACIGSPCTEQALIGFSPRVKEDDRPALVKGLVAAFEQSAKLEKCGLFAVKDIQYNAGAITDLLSRLGYQALESQPSARLAINFRNMEEYFARLSSATRKDMRRKLKAFANVRIEIRDNLSGYEEAVFRLYQSTRARADMTFEELTPAYFTGVLELMTKRAFCALYFVGDDLLAANLLLQNESILLDKFFVMDGALGRAHNLYYLSWFTNLRLCLERGLKEYQSGQAGYANKLRLGSQLTKSSIYFRHRNALINGALHIAAPLLSARHDRQAA